MWKYNIIGNTFLSWEFNRYHINHSSDIFIPILILVSSSSDCLISYCLDPVESSSYLDESFKLVCNELIHFNFLESQTGVDFRESK